MSFPTDNAQEWVDHMIKIGAYVPGCRSCDESIEYLKKHNRTEMAPSHKASDGCESGKRPHCTCDGCF